MATEDDSKRSKFLKKSKWGKLFKENDAGGTGGAAGGTTFKLNDDVQDFLKPSTEKHVPKLDISLAKRWPDAHEVRLAAASDDNLPSKPKKKRRKEGLTVSFARTLPEIMGEGGDEAPDPPREISRRKAVLSRSVSDRKTAALPDGTPWPASPPLTNTRLPPAPAPAAEEEPFVAPPQLRRSQTADIDFSLPLQRKFAPPPAQNVEPYRPSIGRTPTGTSGTHSQQRISEDQRPPSRARPMVDTQFQDRIQEPDSAASYDQTPQDGLTVRKRDHLLDPSNIPATSPVAVKRREMSTNEGMALRRASMLIQDDEDEDEDRPSSSGGPLHSLTSQESYSSSRQYQPESQQEPIVTPETASTTQSLNPFSDPKYTKRHSKQAFYDDQRPNSTDQRSARVVPQIVPPAYPNQPTLRDEGSNASHARSYEGFDGPPRETSRSPAYSAASDRSQNFFARANGSSRSVNAVPPLSQHGRTESRDALLQPGGTVPQHGSSISYGSQTHDSHERDAHPSLLSPGRNGHSPQYSTQPQDQYAAPSHQRSVRSPVAFLRHEDKERPTSSASHHSLGREDDPAAEAAYADFASRVAHVKGVFRLTAEKELPENCCTSTMWLRAGLWWYLKGKAGLEILLQQRDHRPLLTQAHVDLGKAWWILTDQLEPPGNMGSALDHGVSALRSHLRSMSLSMTKNNLLPPEQSLIQGQDTRIWLHYPRFTADATAVLGGNISNSVIINDNSSNAEVDPYELLPLGDSREFFCYGRFPVEMYINTDEADTDRVLLPCILTVMRSRRDYQTSITIASQAPLVSLKIEPARDGKRAITWNEVSWKSTFDGLNLRLPRNFDAIVQMQGTHCRAVWNLSEYARKVERSLQPEADETLLNESRLLELQYADSANSHSFPAEKLRGCVVLIFERFEQYRDGNGLRRFNRGFRLVLVTDPGHKTLSAVALDIGKGTPVLFEFLTGADPAAGVGLLLRKRDGTRQCRALMVLPSVEGREQLFGLLTGAHAGVDDVVVGKTRLSGLKIEATADRTKFAEPDMLQHLHWSSLTILNAIQDETQHPKTVESDHLRFIAKHAAGCITDRLNLGKGELVFRLPLSSESSVIQILREPQADLTISVDTRHSPPQLEDSLTNLLQLVQAESTIRTLTFASQPDLHIFQRAITGFTVCFDGIASTFGISRRRMVVPIYKKWEAADVRVQILAKDGVVQICAFMQDFKPADALCFRVKSTDVFEAFGGKKSFGVKIVDAKFTLPKEEEREEPKRLFVNLEGLEYAEEHDDISVGFEREDGMFDLCLSFTVLMLTYDAVRDSFASALPAATTTVSRGLTMKRRI